MSLFFFITRNFRDGLLNLLEKIFFSVKKTFTFLKFSMISREKNFAFFCFEISPGINFRELGSKTRKTRKFLPAKISALKVSSVSKSLTEVNILTQTRIIEIPALEDTVPKVIGIAEY